MSLETLEVLPATGLWTIDPIHSTVRFGVRHHAVATFRSGFTGVTGSYDAATGTLAGEVRVDAIDLGVERLKAHLLTDAFFDAERFPTLSFTSCSIRPEDGGLELDGEITIRGVTHPVTAETGVRGPVTVRHNDGRISDRLGIDLTGTIDRRNHGIKFNNEISEGILNLGWDVTIEVALELVGAPAAQ
jgi:polyisoprenoid-binding protein YceI